MRVPSDSDSFRGRSSLTCRSHPAERLTFSEKKRKSVCTSATNSRRRRQLITCVFLAGKLCVPCVYVRAQVQTPRPIRPGQRKKNNKRQDLSFLSYESAGRWNKKKTQRGQKVIIFDDNRTNITYTKRLFFFVFGDELGRPSLRENKQLPLFSSSSASP